MKAEVLARRGDLYAIEASHRDLLHVALRLREEDWRDAEAISPLRPRQALWHTAWGSDWVVAVRRGDELTGLCLALIGVARAPMPGVGICWMLSAAEFFDYKRTLARFTRPFVARMFERYHTLTNWVDVRNHTSLRWLDWCGFTIEETVPFGHYQLPFHRVEMRRPA